MRARHALLFVAFASLHCGGREDAPSEGIEDTLAAAVDSTVTLPSTDGGTPSRDASFRDTDASDADAAYCVDSGHDLGATLTIPCAAPLSESASFDDPPITEWCMGANALGYETSSCECGGYLAVYVGVGTDCFREYLFDASTRTLVARLDGCSGTAALTCVEGPSELVLSDSDCFHYAGPGGIMHFVPHDWPVDAGCP